MKRPYICECPCRCGKRILLEPSRYNEAARLGAVLDYLCALTDNRVILREVDEGIVVVRTGRGGRPGRMSA